MSGRRELCTPLRTIMTPGPVEVDPRVLRVMSTPVVGQFDPAFTGIMNETMEMLRELFQTKTAGHTRLTALHGRELKQCWLV